MNITAKIKGCLVIRSLSTMVSNIYIPFSWSTQGKPKTGANPGKFSVIWKVKNLGSYANRAPSMWDGVEERARRRLALWKRQYISKGGRITLIKSTLASMPIYQMSIFRMSKIVARRLEKVQRDFL